MARSPIASGGVPGSWLKWYEGSFSQNGLGGIYSPLSDIVGPTVAVLSLDYNTKVLLSVGEFANGVFMSVSDENDPTQWTYIPFPIVLSDGMTWNRDIYAPELYAYPMFVAEDGNSEIVFGDVFYLYNTYLFPQQDFANRYLMRQSITPVIYTDFNLAPTSAPVITMLARYINGSNYWTSNKLVLPPFSFDKEIGFISTTNAEEGNVLLYECQINTTQYVVQATHCSEGKIYRILGYMWDSPGESRVAVYFCAKTIGVFSSSFLSIDPDCDGVYSMRSTPLGYVLDPK